MSANYLTRKIAESKRTLLPRYGMSRQGYTLRSGAPTSVMVRLEGDRIWRRVMVWQFSNAGTAFVRIKGEAFVVSDIPEPSKVRLCTEHEDCLQSSQLGAACAKGGAS